MNFCQDISLGEYSQSEHLSKNHDIDWKMSENDVPLLDQEVLPYLANTKFSHWQHQILAHCMMLEIDVALRPVLSQKKNTTAQILVDYMGGDNYARFISDENR
ncbi:hypothetical protein MJO29_016012 [Puccinia striiformis f. sp. tritici]|nr:hypothetical protein MJO29_016012 [Puccinia striiformis f. sp. tritici]